MARRREHPFIDKDLRRLTIVRAFVPTMAERASWLMNRHRFRGTCAS